MKLSTDIEIIAKRMFEREGSDIAEAYLQGIIDGANAFAIWGDGEQYLGIQNWTMRDLRNAVYKLSVEMNEENRG